ncbi:DNA/RNA non-specific endonuclease [Sphingomonas cannabina]|uniref:DNA/RNA non-specific endonuclease n=1 Tax=Sphingomonas cannabina TaxID=2899123 RepID=UPI001F394D4F|nr:DNA/RNA non-specific endonuclease [Sphingomonas cannabina]UIJ45120.1 DNA/RNA non-specific endonuclease [Sphingomonas cannabina]
MRGGATSERTRIPAASFETYLRTGRRTWRVERKYNHWHDPEDGRFTFAGGGIYVGEGNGASLTDDQPGAGDRAAASSRSSTRAAPQVWAALNPRDPLNPRNHSIHVVRRGETLTSIAAKRKGVTVADLAWLNGIRADRPLRVGQLIKLPHQAFLDAGREAKNKTLALFYYADTHGRRLPPDPARPPTLASQLLDTNWRAVRKNGYDFQIDPIVRTRRIRGELSLDARGQRSRYNQAQAGGQDRRRGDDGGHYIAVRFNGPSDKFNHFAQDRNFNRGGYRALENDWARELQNKHRVFVDIVPHYTDFSTRPDRIRITWYVDGKRRFQEFPNEAERRSNGKR